MNCGIMTTGYGIITEAEQCQEDQVFFREPELGEGKGRDTGSERTDCRYGHRHDNAVANAAKQRPFLPNIPIGLEYKRIWNPLGRQSKYRFFGLE